MDHRPVISVGMARRTVACGLAASVIALAGCGNGSPSAPDGGDQIVATGPQIFRMALQTPCAAAGRDFVPVVYSHVVVNRVGSEWVATATTAAGNLDLRFHQSSARVLANSMQISGTIKGVAVHMPELVQFPAYDARATFGIDGPTTITGVAFTPGFLGSQTGGLDGIGSGSVVVLGDSSDRTCSGAAFSWSIFPPQTP